MYNLQRDRPPWLPEGDNPGNHPYSLVGVDYQGARRQAVLFLGIYILALSIHYLVSCLQMGKAEGVINSEIPNCWECPRCTQEGRTSKVKQGLR